VPLAAGQGISIGLHPSEDPIRLRANASMPLTVCPDGNSDIGTGLSWPSRRFSECLRFTQDEWLQMPSSRTAGDHLGFRIVAGQSGAISSLIVSYQRVDPFFIIVTSSSVMTAMTSTFTPAGTSAAVGLYSDQKSSPASQIAVTQAGNAKPEIGPCTFLSEASECFLGLVSGQPVTVRVLQAPADRTAVLGFSWP
jgi:hypothetical protein